MQDYREISWLTERIIHKYTQVEKIKRSYGTDMLLSRAEIHTVAKVGDHEGMNVTSLAKQQGITKGAASQMVYKLVEKGLLEKRVSPNSDTEVSLSLTDIGRKAYQAHREYHEQADEEFFNMLRNMPKEVEQQLMAVLAEFDKALDERLKSGKKD